MKLLQHLPFLLTTLVSLVQAPSFPLKLQKRLNALTMQQSNDLLKAFISDRVSDTQPLQPTSKSSSPTGEYAPGNVACPPIESSRGLIRDAQRHAIGPDEAVYIQRHRLATQPLWRSWLTDKAGLDGPGGIPGGVQSYTSNFNNLPKIGFAFSGGGYRAMLNGGGMALGFDNRNAVANQRGTGGLFQMADYVSGLSGGSWAIGSYAINNWKSAQELKDNVYNLESNLIFPDHRKLQFYADLVADVVRKAHAGFETGIVDYWGRALSYHLLDSSHKEHGQATCFSDIRNQPNFQNAAYPYPIVIACEREPGTLAITKYTSLWEFSPFEFGTWDSKIAGFIPTQYLGTRLYNGRSTLPGDQCVEGFDNFGWVVGTSSTLFNALYNRLLGTKKFGLFQGLFNEILEQLSRSRNDISWLPNPFFGYKPATSDIFNVKVLNLVDGGEDAQNIPLWPLVEPGRGLDFVFALDSSSNSNHWPNGSAIHTTFLRALESQYSDYPFPVIPSPNTFINRGLNTRPVFFGCDAANNVANRDTAFNGFKTPIIAYMPTYPYLGMVNTSTFKLEYSSIEAQASLDNGVAISTLGGVDPTWPTCLGCAMLQRSLERTGTPRPAKCDVCMAKWCWDGITDDSPPAQEYAPPVGSPAFLHPNGLVQPVVNPRREVTPREQPKSWFCRLSHLC
ncbi:putative lysophospholipase [Violaceomyces palustris]|uniref:Lysophospholipase n=1 Tax=Violaceomyces palustris TaxID=1673888 RepID=A0ACD0NMX7_9BASI|nr:putative lysophospholipase [Violaceomyces palustris]